MDEFNVEVVNIAQEAEQLKMKEETSRTSPDEAEEVGCVETIPCQIEVMREMECLPLEAADAKVTSIQF